MQRITVDDRYKMDGSTDWKNGKTDEEIFSENEKLIYFVLNRELKKDRSVLCNMEYCDLVQEGAIALLNAIRKFDESRGLAFSSYATKCIYNAFRLSTMSNRYLIRVPRGAQTKAVTEGAEATEALKEAYRTSSLDAHDDKFYMCGDGGFEDRIIDKIAIDCIIRTLPPLHQDIVRTYLELQSLRETARRVNVGYRTALRVVQKLKKRVAEELSEDEL